MKLGKEELQKLVLGGMLMIGVIYGYFDFLLLPLKKRQEDMQKSTAALAPEIKSALAQIRKTEDLERTVADKTLVLRQVDEMIPEGSPVAWFPTKVGEFFRQQGIDKATTKINSEAPEKEMPGFRRMAWGIDLPKVAYDQLGGAIAALENQEPLLEIRTMQIDASRDDAEAQRSTITVMNLVKQ